MSKIYVNTKFGKMFVRFDNFEVDNKKTIILLHGFKMDSTTFNSLVTKLKDYSIVRVDLLGFGKSNQPNKPMNVSDYAELIKDLCQKYEITKPIIIGHSFGGRIAIKLANIMINDTIILINAKAFKNKSIKHKMRIIKYKLIKSFYRVFLKKRYLKYINSKGSDDYKDLSKVMKKTFINIVNEDLGKDLKKIKSKVCVIGSINDNTVLYDETLKIYNKLPNAKLYPCYNSGHFSYIDEESKVVRIIKLETKTGDNDDSFI